MGAPSLSEGDGWTLVSSAGSAGSGSPRLAWRPRAGAASTAAGCSTPPLRSSSSAASDTSSSPASAGSANQLMASIEDSLGPVQAPAEVPAPPTGSPEPPALLPALPPALPPVHLLAAAGSSRLDICLPRRSFHLGVLVVGEAGCGKSTLISNIFSPFAKPRTYSTVAATEIGTGVPTGVASTGGQLREFEAATEAADFSYSVLEMALPSFDSSAVHAACRLVSGRDQEYEQRWAAARSARQASELSDGRIDVCLCMLPPHSLSEAAVAAIRQLSEHVPVLPVLGKADAVTPSELSKLRGAAVQQLGLQGPLAFPSHPELLAGEAIALGAGALPLAAVGSLENKAGMDSFWPARVYPWGCVEVFNSSHSDLLLLRKLLLEAGLFQLKDATDQRPTASPASAASPAASPTLAASPATDASPPANRITAGSHAATADASTATVAIANASAGRPDSSSSQPKGSAGTSTGAAAAVPADPPASPVPMLAPALVPLALGMPAAAAPGAGPLVQLSCPDDEEKGGGSGKGRREKKKEKSDKKREKKRRTGKGELPTWRGAYFIEDDAVDYAANAVDMFIDDGGTFPYY